MERMYKLLEEYAEKFDDNFPIFMVMGMSDDDIIEILEDSIANDRKYNPEMIEGVIY